VLYNFLADSFHTKKLCSRLSSNEVRFYMVNDDDHFRLIKRGVDFLLVLIELFSLGVTAEALRANIGSKSAISLQQGPVNLKFQEEKGCLPPTIFLFRKLC